MGAGLKHARGAEVGKLQIGGFPEIGIRASLATHGLGKGQEDQMAAVSQIVCMQCEELRWPYASLREYDRDDLRSWLRNHSLRKQQYNYALLTKQIVF